MPQAELAGESLPISNAALADHMVAGGAQVVSESAFEALAIELWTRALPDKLHGEPSSWQCGSKAAIDWKQLLRP